MAMKSPSFPRSPADNDPWFPLSGARPPVFGGRSRFRCRPVDSARRPGAILRPRPISEDPVKKPLQCFGLLILLACAASGAAAQDLAQLCQAMGKLSVGQWASYAVEGGPMNGSSLRFAIIGSEQHSDSTFY